MAVLGQILSGVGGLISLVCFILVVVKMFQNGQTGVGIASIVLLLCCIGGLVAFVFGWMKANEWGIKNVMLAWTGGIGLSILGNILTAAGGGGFVPQQ